MTDNTSIPPTPDRASFGGKCNAKPPKTPPTGTGEIPRVTRAQRVRLENTRAQNHEHHERDAWSFTIGYACVFSVPAVYAVACVLMLFN